MEQRRLGNLGACRRPRLCSVKASGARSRAVPPVLRLQSYPFGPMAARGTDDPHLVILSPGPAVMSADPAVGGKPGGRPTAWAVQPSWRARAARRDRHWPSSAGPSDGRNNDSVSGAGERVADPGPQGGQGAAPACRAVTCPRRSTSSAGMAWAPNRCEIRGEVPAFTLTSLTWPARSRASCSSAGLTTRQGPTATAAPSTTQRHPCGITLRYNGSSN